MLTPFSSLLLIALLESGIVLHPEKERKSTMIEKLFLSTKELAIRWNVSRVTLRRWRSQNIGPKFSKIGCHASYKVEDIEEFEKSRECKGNIDQMKLLCDKEPGD